MEAAVLADYQKMYAVLCGAIDDVLDELFEIPKARAAGSVLQRALEQAEELYIQSSAAAAPACGKVIELRFEEDALRDAGKPVPRN